MIPKYINCSFLNENYLEVWDEEESTSEILYTKNAVRILSKSPKFGLP